MSFNDLVFKSPSSVRAFMIRIYYYRPHMMHFHHKQFYDYRFTINKTTGTVKDKDVLLYMLGEVEEITKFKLDTFDWGHPYLNEDSLNIPLNQIVDIKEFVRDYRLALKHYLEPDNCLRFLDWVKKL